MRPPQGSDDTPSTVEFGIAALDGQLDEELFPVTADEIVETLDDPQVPYDAKGRSVALSEALAEADADLFEDEDDLLNELYPVFEEYRNGTGPGLVGWLRNRLPW
jgi:hypothetical protein